MKIRTIPHRVILSTLLLITIMACSAVPGGNSPDPATVEPTAGEPTLESMLTVQLVSFDNETIYNHNQRRANGLNLWPDGNIGVVPNGDQFTFFAANGPLMARTVGTLDDPAAKMEANKYLIEGDFSEYNYVAGGPVYRDPETGILLLFYHAEIHFGEPVQFQSLIGLARSTDDGKTFQDLGPIVENNTQPNEDFNCCADVGGGTFAIKDGQFYLFFRDRLISGYDNQLALAVAPVDEVLAAAQNGMVTEWRKYNNGQYEPALGGVSSPLEIGNPRAGWYSVMYSTVLNQFVLVSDLYETLSNRSMLYLTTSPDGITWSPRVMLRDYEGFITYPTMVSLDGSTQLMDNTFYLYYTTTPNAEARWKDTSLERATVTISSETVPAPSEWNFDKDVEGWRPFYNLSMFEVIDGALVVDGLNDDPQLASPTLGLSTDEYSTIEIRLKTDVGGDAQIFFTSSAATDIFTDNGYKFFPIQASDDFQVYQVYMADVPGWEGYLGYLRFDPVGGSTHTEIDYVKFIP